MGSALNKANAILDEKNNKIIPQNIKSGVQIFDVTGEYAPTQTLQTKSVTITENGTTTVEPDTGYDGLSSLEVVTNVSGGGSEYNVKMVTNPTISNPNYLLNKCVQNLPDFDLTNVSGNSITGIFRNCELITDAPNIIIPANIVLATSLFAGCTNLVNIPIYDFSKITDLQFAFSDCPNLSNESLNNILYMCIHSHVTSGSKKKLSYIGLSSEQATTCQTLSNWNDFVNAGWSSGY